MSKKKGPTPRRPWTPFVETDVTDNDHDDSNEKHYVNSRYLVSVTFHSDEGMDGPLHLSIHDHTRSARHDWRDFQRIKTEIVGAEREAFELYPAESRVVDTSNEYHLWVLPAGEQVPVGWRERVVRDQDDDVSLDDLRDIAKERGISPERLQRISMRAKQRRLSDVPADRSS